MSKSVGKFTYPGFCCVPMKPRLLGDKYYRIACGTTGILYVLTLFCVLQRLLVIKLKKNQWERGDIIDAMKGSVEGVNIEIHCLKELVNLMILVIRQDSGKSRRWEEEDLNTKGSSWSDWKDIQVPKVYPQSLPVSRLRQPSSTTIQISPNNSKVQLSRAQADFFPQELLLQNNFGLLQDCLYPASLLRL